MDKNPLNKGVLTENSGGIGPVTREMVNARARELAEIAGRAVSKVDREQARRELTGETSIDPQEDILEAAPESDRDISPGSTGRQVPETPNEDEDEEGRSESQQLVQEGVNEAEHDQMLQAARAARNKNRL
jgi:hypothetical protein